MHFRHTLVQKNGMEEILKKNYPKENKQTNKNNTTFHAHLSNSCHTS